MSLNVKKAPDRKGAFHHRPGVRSAASILLPGPDTRVVRTVSLPNTRGDIEAGKLREDVMAPAGSVVVLNVGDGNRMDRFTARIVGKALALCSVIQVEGDGFGPNFRDAHYLYGLDEIAAGIREVAAEEAENLRDWEVTA
ncbi:hypothetical protein ABZ307_28360 [Streptomyces griseorubiginosus]|uniref:hypothetical protein n=1 Tax=Streptomyces griseorubiginosus TaxID=67304 RepID=UPI0033B597C7